jgi:signal transduction histidine kinase
LVTPLFATLYILLLIGIAALGGYLALYSWNRRIAPGAKAYAAFMATMACYMVCLVLEFAAGDLATKILWSKMEYISAAIVPLIWLGFSLQFTERGGWLSRPKLAILSLIPAITLALVWTNEYHGLIWNVIPPEVGVPFRIMLVAAYGSWFWVFWAYNSILILAGSVILIADAVASKRHQRGQIAALILGAILPWLSILAFIFRLNPYNEISIAHFAYIPAGLLIAWALFNYRAFDALPTAYDVLTRGMADGIMIVNPQGAITNVNPASEGILKRPMQVLLGKQAASVLPRWLDAGERELNVTAKYFIDAPDSGQGAPPAQKRYYEMGISRIVNRKEEHVGWLVLIHDITNLKQREEHLQTHSAELEAMVDKTQRLLKEKERLAAIGETAAIVGHDLRNPLQSIANTLFLMNDTLKEMPESEFKRTMVSHSERFSKNVFYMEKIVSDLQDFSRNLEPSLVEVGLSQVVDDAAASIIVPSNIAMTKVVPADLRIKADPLLMRRMLVNLFSNAIQAMPDGGTLLVSAASEGKTIRIAIIDNGVGMSGETMSQLFRPLFTTKAKGMGMGLAVIKRIVEAHNGTINIQSRPGEGTTVMISLPQQ